MTYSERDLMRVFFKRITACLFDSSENLETVLHVRTFGPHRDEDVESRKLSHRTAWVTTVLRGIAEGDIDAFALWAKAVHDLGMTQHWFELPLDILVSTVDSKIHRVAHMVASQANNAHAIDRRPVATDEELRAVHLLKRLGYDVNPPKRD
jgi:hypothetical protein